MYRYYGPIFARQSIVNKASGFDIDDDESSLHGKVLLSDGDKQMLRVIKLCSVNLERLQTCTQLWC
jgi:hypothetical protein